jgi:hypothetical protein
MLKISSAPISVECLLSTTLLLGGMAMSCRKLSSVSAAQGVARGGCSEGRDGDGVVEQVEG